jgi:ABC-2 type transport system ATP-binding protein
MINFMPERSVSTGRKIPILPWEVSVMPSYIAAKNLHKEFGTIVAVDDISLSVRSGEVLGFLGPNGAGKTTTMRILTGYLRPDGGSIEICGLEMFKDPVKAKSMIGYLPEGAPLYPEMTPSSFLRFTGEVRGFGGADLQHRVEEAADLVNLRSVWNQPIETLSKGYKRRLGLAQAILHDPEILILDEPTDGLDPNQKSEVRELVRRMAKSKAIIISTHILEEVHAVCTRAAIINKGLIAADGTPADLEAMSIHNNAVSILVSSEKAGGLADKLEKAPFIRTVETVAESSGRIRVWAFPKDGQIILHEVAALIRDGKYEVDEFRQETGRLDEVFRSLTVPVTAAAQGERT